MKQVNNQQPKSEEKRNDHTRHFPFPSTGMKQCAQIEMDKTRNTSIREMKKTQTINDNY